MSTIKLTGTSSGSSIIKAPDSGSTNQTFTLPASSGTLVTTTDAGVAGITSAADATAITINSSEQVGIGKTPVNTLDVNHSGGAIVKLWRDSNSGYLQFDTDGTNSHIKNGGGPIKFKTGGDTVRASVTDNGICFGTDTAAANALDDYEEGTWTMTLVGGSTPSGNSPPSCRYVKVGNMVTCYGMWWGVSISGSATAGMGGLPFTSKSGTYITGTTGANTIVEYGAGMWGYTNSNIYLINNHTMAEGTNRSGNPRYLSFSITYEVA